VYREGPFCPETCPPHHKAKDLEGVGCPGRASHEDTMSAEHRLSSEEAAEAIIDWIAEEVAEQYPPGIPVAAKIDAVRETSRRIMQSRGIEIADADFERLLRELCRFNFITEEVDQLAFSFVDDEGAP
jgi:hypothetical protein